MSKDKATSLIPTKDEVKEILSQVFQAQANQDPKNLPATILQAWVGRIVINALKRMDKEYDKSASEFRAEVEKAVEGFEKEVKSVFERAA